MPPVSLYRGQGITLLSSAARTTSSNTGDLKDTSGAIPVGTAVTLWLNVTANTGDTCRLAVYLDTSPDGSTWFLAEKFNDVTASSSAQCINFRQTGLGNTEVAAQQWVNTTTGGVAIAQNVVLGASHRIRWELPNGTTYSSTPSATFAVFATVQPL